MRRLETLDWHRGALACSVMVYHLTCWLSHEPQSGEVLGRLGLYSVSMFFVLSGLSMGLVYGSFIREWRSSAAFLMRRVFRIWPLLWVAVLVESARTSLLGHQELKWSAVFLNLTTLFGFVDPGAAINTGAWSIGNEMVYYSLTPLLILAFERRVFLGNLLVLASVLAGAYFSFGVLSTHASLAAQWKSYINPVNNFFFYTSGLALYYNCRDWRLSGRMSLALFLGSAAVLFFYPAHGDVIHLVAGPNRVIFYIASLLMVLSIYTVSMAPPAWISKPLSRLGMATYGIYLLHPLAFLGVRSILTRLTGQPTSLALAVLAAISTIAMSLLSYSFFEEPLIRLGKRLTSPGREIPGPEADLPPRMTGS